MKISNNGYGILLSMSSYNNLTGNNVSSNTVGISLVDSNENILINNIVSSNVYEGIYLYQSSYNNLTGNNVSSNSLQGILLNESSNNNLTNNIVNSNRGSGIVLNYNSNNNILVNNTANSNTDSWGIGLAYSQNNTLINNNASLNTWGGIYLHYANNNTLINNTAASNSGSGLGWGIHLHNSNYSNFTNNTAYGNNIADIRIQNNSLGNAFVNQTIAGNTLTTYQTKISFTYFRDVDIKGVTTPPSSPSGMRAINKYVNATNQSPGAWLFLNVSYNDSDLQGANENSLRMAKYNNTWFTMPSAFANNYGVDTMNNIVYANITLFSIFAPLADVAAPNVTLNSPKNDTGTRNTTITFNCSAIDYGGLANATLYVNFSGSWQANGTNNISGTSNSTTFTRTLQEGNYVWNCYACDASNNCSFASTNFSLIVDTTLPMPFFVSPTPENGTIINKPWVYINVSVNDTNKASALIDWNYSLRGYWAFEETSGTTVYDNSTYANAGIMQNMNSGTDNGTSGRTIFGRNGRGMMFDGINDYIVGSSSPFGFPDTTFTIEAWFKTTNCSTNGNVIMAEGGVGGGWFVGTAENCKMFVLLKSGSDGANAYVAKSTSTFGDGKWHHAVFIINTSTTDPNKNSADIYVDGILLTKTEDKITTYAQSNANWTIGRRETNPYLYFNGTIDEIRIWSRALTPSEINASYNNGLYRLEKNFTSLSDGAYSYYALAIDRASNMNRTETRIVYIDATGPTINFVPPTPNNASYQQGTSATINVSVIDAFSNIDSCIIEFDNVNRSMIKTSNGSSTYCYYTNSSLTEGQHTFKVYANDTAGNMNSTTIRIFYVDLTNPIAYQGLPENNSFIANRTITFSLKCSDNMQVNTLQLWSNFTGTWKANVTNSTPVNNSWWNVSVTVPADGWYKWAAYCNDSSGRYNFSENRTFYVNTQAPLVYLNLPQNASSVYGVGATLVSTEFNCSAYDSGGLKNITLYGNWNGWGAKNSSNISGTSNSSKWFNNLNESSYIYNCLACDRAENCGFNLTNYTFRVRTNPSVVFVPPTPTQGYARSNVTINTTITDWNLGSASLDFDSSLRGYWAFNEESGIYVYDNSTFSNTGILVNGPTRAAGIFGNALQFNGSNYVRVNDSDSLDLTNALTIEAWIKTNRTGSILSKLDSYNNGYNLLLYESGGTYFISLKMMCNSWVEASVAANYTDNQWHHIAVTYDSNTENIIFYFDGEKKLSNTSASGNITNSVGPLLIGRDNSSAQPKYFNGSIDEVKIHSRVLTWEEINASMNNSRYRLYTTIYNLPAESEHNFSVIASDTDGNMNRTETLRFTVDIAPPIITIISPENTTYNPTWVWANVSLNENGSSCNYSLDGFPNVSMTKLNGTYFYKNVSNLAEGIHNITFFCSDLAGNINQSEYVYFRINDAPQIFFVPPSDPNHASVGRNWTYINTSIADNDNISTCILEWDGVNETMHINNGPYNETNESIESIILSYEYDAADVYAILASGGGGVAEYSYAFQMKWNISALPPNATIEEALLCVYWAASPGFTIDNDVNISRVNDQGWDESIDAEQWNSQNLANITLSNWSSVEPNTWGCVNVTDIVKEDYMQGHEFSSVRLQDPDYRSDRAIYVIDDRGLYFGGPFDYLIAEDRENSMGSLGRPYLNITLATGSSYEAKANCYLNKSDNFGRHTYKVYANDTYGKFGLSETRTIIFGNAVNECMNITEPGIYVLTKSLKSNGTCIRIFVDNVSLYCNNHSIGYSMLETGNAIWVNSSNVSIENCSIMQSNISVLNAHGIVFYGSFSNITKSKFEIASNASAIYLRGISNFVSENVIHETYYGVYVDANANENVIKKNTFYWNSIDVFISHNADNNILEKNTHLTSDVSVNYFSLTENLKINSSSRVAPAPNDYKALGKYINVTAIPGSEVN
ncbi:MAG: LamG-like jellyroll fold domain-containing protein [Candidatus Aenigmatarchaeota archaeon]